MMEPGFSNVLEEVAALHERKHADYNGKRPAWKEFGMLGRFFDLNRKFERIKTLMWEKRDMTWQTKDETLRDTLVDLIVYCVLAILLLDEENKQDEQAIDRIDAPRYD